MRRIIIVLAAIVAIALAVIGGLRGSDPESLAIVSGSENKALEPIITDWGRKNGVDVTMTYKGSVDISRILEQGSAGGFDAVWPANSLWIALGDRSKLVKHDQSVLRSPVVLGLKRSIAEDLGWTTRDDVTIQEIRDAARAGRFKLAMTSATQSNSGASAYFGILYAMAGNPDVLTLDHLADPALQADVAEILAQVDRSSGSSGWLKDKLVEQPEAFDAMFNYEALVIEANQALTAAGQEPLYAIYPANGLAVANSPLGYVDKADPAREEAFLSLQAHLASAEVQETLVALGRRAGLIGLSADSADPRVWNPDWGIDLTRAIAPIPTPEAEVIDEALSLYQTELRKPSLTIWVLDVSGSMEGEPLAQLKQSMALLLDPEASAVNLLQPSRRDVTILLPFNELPAAPESVEGNDPAELAQMMRRVSGLSAGGGTDLYHALVVALETLEARHAEGKLFDYLPAIVAMTDGASDISNRDAFLNMMARSPIGRDVPIHTIAFGQADKAQLQELNEGTLGRLFTAGDDLAAALRKAKGYN